MKKKVQKLSIWKKVFIIVTLGVILFTGWFIIEIFKERYPIFFPLNDPQAEYTITKQCPHGQGWEEQVQTQGNAYCLEYKGAHVLLKEDHGNSNFFRITIGKSALNLETYVGKKVKNIKGNYTSSRKQCIQQACIDINGPYVVVNIDTVELAN